MAGPDSPIWPAAFLLSTVLVLIGCGSGGAGRSKPEIAATSEPSAVETPVEVAVEQEAVDPAPPIEVLPEIEPEAEAAAAEEPGEPVADEDETLVVIDTGARDLTAQPVTLIEAARAERERRNLAPPTDIVITDKNLAEYATGGLTVAEPASPESAAASSELSAAEIKRAEEEAYWRNGVREIRQAWRDAWDRIGELEGKVFELRQQFYREDDGFYRDAEIKPAWDRSIEQLEEARAEVESRQQELIEFTEQGRAAGALPGWLREGVDLEPPISIEQEDTVEPSEPVIYQQEASDPP